MSFCGSLPKASGRVNQELSLPAPSALWRSGTFPLLVGGKWTSKWKKKSIVFVLSQGQWRSTWPLSVLVHQRSPLCANLVQPHVGRHVRHYSPIHIYQRSFTGRVGTFGQFIWLLVPNSVSLAVRGGEHLHQRKKTPPFIWQFQGLSKGSLIWSNELSYERRALHRHEHYPFPSMLS